MPSPLTDVVPDLFHIVLVQTRLALPQVIKLLALAEPQDTPDRSPFSGSHKALHHGNWPGGAGWDRL